MENSHHIWFWSVHLPLKKKTETKRYIACIYSIDIWWNKWLFTVLSCFYFCSVCLFTKRKHNFCIHIAAKWLQLHKSPKIRMHVNFVFLLDESRNWFNKQFSFNCPVYRYAARSNNFAIFKCSNDEYLFANRCQIWRFASQNPCCSNSSSRAEQRRAFNVLTGKGQQISFSRFYGNMQHSDEPTTK